MQKNLSENILDEYFLFFIYFHFNEINENALLPPLAYFGKFLKQKIEHQQSLMP
jgi:hypothetical protein